MSERDPMDDDEGFSLHEIERGLRQLEATGGRAALELKKARLELVERRKSLRRARITATFASEGTVQMKNAYVDRETDTEQYECELAEVAVRYCADLVDERSSTRSSLQTRAKLVVEAMRLAGHGEGS